jgi:hypothetical protein
MKTNDLFKAATKAVMELDLERVKTKLMHAKSGEGWSLQKANAVEKEYRRLLCLMKLYPNADTAPTVDADIFWHYHILDTMRYAADCKQVFGYFLHHDPHVGLGDSEEEDRLRGDSGDRMRELYEATFAEAYPGGSTEVFTAVTTASRAGAAHDRRRLRLAGATAFCAGPGGNKLSPPRTEVRLNA